MPYSNYEERKEYFREYRRRNKDAINANSRRYYKDVKLNRRRIFSKYNITEDQYNQMIADQNNTCAICFSDTPGGRGTWSIDHNHSCCPGVSSCGKCVRQLLCAKCNMLLGAARESSTILLEAIEYLRRHNV